MSTENPLTGSPADAEPGASVDEQLEVLLEEYGGVLRGAISRLCPRNLVGLTDDILQEARVRLWNALKSERKIENPASYLYRVAATATIDAVRRIKARREEPLEAEDELPGEASSTGRRPLSPEEMREQGDLQRVLDQCFARLPPPRRRAVGLHLQGFTTRQIGDVLGWTEAKARNLVYRGLGDLRDMLRAQGISYEG
jgi:RNA polymerase sigma-70 factor (ECF subfamily)